MKLFRLCYISFILARYGIDSIMLMVPWFYPFRFLAFLNPFHYFTRHRARGERLRLAFEHLGPIFIKFGQILSTRRDWLPQDIIDELAKLQDRVPPFASEKAQAIIEKSLGQELTAFFSNFESQALASASIAQVHGAVLNSGQRVVIKVLRPNIGRAVARDLSLLKIAAKIVQRLLPIGRRVRFVEIIKEFERVLHCELDFRQEAANASQLRHYSQQSERSYIPKIYWDYCNDQILVMERIEGTPISDVKALQTQGRDMAQLGNNLIEMFFSQVFNDNFFHGDLHPGNVFVAREKPQLILVDFGVAGSLSTSDQRYIAENLLAFLKRDYQRVAELHQRSGWLPEQENMLEFAAAIRTISEPLFEQPLHAISIGHLLLSLFKTARQYHINIQPQLILLQKNLLYAEGLAQQLNPHLNLWQTIKPFLERWMKQQMGVQSLLRTSYDKLPYWLEKLPEVPELIYDALQHISQDRTRQLLPIKKTKRKKSLRLILLSGIILIASALNFALMPQAVVLAWFLLALGSMGLLIAYFT